MAAAVDASERMAAAVDASERMADASERMAAADDASERTAAADAESLELWVEALYPHGEMSREWRNLVAYKSRAELEDLPDLIDDADLLFGEFQLAHFFGVVDEAAALIDEPLAKVVDLGSGCGRLVLALAKRRPDLGVAGLEYQPRLHDVGAAALARAGLANAELHCGDLHDAAATRRACAGAGVVFCYSTALFCEGDEDVASRLSDALRVLAPGTVVVTTDRRLRKADFELVAARKELPGSIAGATVDVYFSKRR